MTENDPVDFTDLAIEIADYTGEDPVDIAAWLGRINRSKD